MTVSVGRAVMVGSTGRVGRAILGRLTANMDVQALGRYDIADPTPFMDDLRVACEGADCVLNVAGVAHLSADPTTADLHRLVAANVAMPLDVARVCVESGTSMVHVSSSKAASLSGSSNAYEWSKRAGDAALAHAFDESFTAAQLSLAIVRPPALLFPPFEAGKLRWFRALDRLPARFVPPIPLPVVGADEFAALIEDLVAHIDARPKGVSFVDVGSDQRADLRTVRAAMAMARGSRS